MIHLLVKLHNILLPDLLWFCLSQPFLCCCCSSCSLASIAFTDLSALFRENSSWTMFACCFSSSCLKCPCVCVSRVLNLSTSASASSSLFLSGCTVSRTSWRCFARIRISPRCSLDHWLMSASVMWPRSSAVANKGCRDEGKPSLWSSPTSASPALLKADRAWRHASQRTRDDSDVWQPTLFLVPFLSTLALWVFGVAQEGGWFCGGNSAEPFGDKQVLLGVVGYGEGDTASFVWQSRAFDLVCFLISFELT